MQRLAWEETRETINPEQLIFLDEFGAKTNFTRLRGWAEIGLRLVESVPAGRWETSTVVHAIALDGTRAAMVLDGPMDSLCFNGFCEWLLTPALNQGDIVVMDNLSSHKSSKTKRIIESVGARVAFLPPYSPDLNPIEKIFSKVKQLIRSASPRTYKEVISSVADALNRVTTRDIESVFDYCGYLRT